MWSVNLDFAFVNMKDYKQFDKFKNDILELKSIYIKINVIF